MRSFTEVTELWFRVCGPLRPSNYITIFWGGYKLSMGRDNSVGIANGYGLDGPGI
jgi:hypothetical protein